MPKLSLQAKEVIFAWTLLLIGTAALFYWGTEISVFFKSMDRGIFFLWAFCLGAWFMRYMDRGQKDE